jgi:hypothetical protein
LPRPPGLPEHESERGIEEVWEYYKPERPEFYRPAQYRFSTVSTDLSLEELDEEDLRRRRSEATEWSDFSLQRATYDKWPKEIFLLCETRLLKSILMRG